MACFRRESGCLPPGAWRPVMYVGRSQIQREQGGHPAGRAKPHLTSSRHHCRLGEQLHAPRPCGGPPSCQLVHEHGPCAEWTEAHLSPATTTRESDMFVPKSGESGSGAGRQKMALERGTNPKLSRRTCTCEYWLQSCLERSAGSRRKNGLVSALPPEIPDVTIRNFSIAVRSGKSEGSQGRRAGTQRGCVFFFSQR